MADQTMPRWRLPSIWSETRTNPRTGMNLLILLIHR